MKTESRDRKQKEAAAAFVVGEECGNVEALCQTFLKRGQVTFSQRGKARGKKKLRRGKKKKKAASCCCSQAEQRPRERARRGTAAPGAAAEQRQRRGPVPEPRTGRLQPAGLRSRRCCSPGAAGRDFYFAFSFSPDRVGAGGTGWETSASCLLRQGAARRRQEDASRERPSRGAATCVARAAAAGTCRRHRHVNGQTPGRLSTPPCSMGGLF